jgi:Cysteine dioxygenase type I
MPRNRSTVLKPPATRRSPSLPLVPRQIAISLAERQALWRPVVRFARPRFSTRLATAPGWEAWLLTWLPGQSTALHDHGGSDGAFLVLAGELDESVPIRRVPRVGAPARLGLSTHRYRTGEVRTFGADHLHDVANRTGCGRAVSLHVYAPRLTSMTRYLVDSDGEFAVLSREREGVDW